jgi:hypothetical protein
MNIVSSPNRIPIRALFAVPYVAWLVTLAIGTVLSCWLIFQSLIGISHYNAARSLIDRSDRLVASSIASVMASNSTQGQPITHLSTRGALHRENPYRTAWYSFSGSSFFNWDNGSTTPIAAWLRAMGLPKLEPVEKAADKELNQDFTGMKPWPQPGSIKVTGDTLLVKLGNPH